MEKEHENILQFYEYFIDDYYIYLAFEMCLGGTLYEKLCKLQSFNDELLCKIFKQILGTLKYIYQKHDYSYNDFRPEYVFFKNNDSTDSQIKLWNFNIHKLLNECLAIKKNSDFGFVFFKFHQTI